MSKPPSAGSTPALNPSTQAAGADRTPLSAQPQVITTKVLIATPANSGDVGKPSVSLPLAQAGMKPKQLDKKLQVPKSVTTIPIVRHAVPLSGAVTMSPATSGISVPHHMRQGGLLPPQLKVIPGASKLTGITATQVSRGSHITTVRPGLPTATIMRSNLQGHPGGETVLSQVYMYPSQHVQGGSSPLQARLLTPSAVMPNSLRLQAPTSQMAKVADHNRNLNQVKPGTTRGPYQTMQSVGLGQAVLSTDSKLTTGQPITLQVKADGGHPFTSIGGLKHDRLVQQPSMVTNRQQSADSETKPPDMPPVQVQVRMVICSDNLGDKSKGDALHVVGRSDSRLDGGIVAPLQAAGLGKVAGMTPLPSRVGKLTIAEPKKTIKDICDSNEKLSAVGRELKRTATSDMDHQRVYRPEMKMSLLKTDMRHDPSTWQGGGGIVGTATVRHQLGLQPGQHKQAKMMVSQGSLAPSGKTHTIRTHTISSMPNSGSVTSTAATAILVSANTATGAIRQPSPNAIPVAKVYPRQQPLGTTARVISSIRLPTCTGITTTSATGSYQPTSMIRAPGPTSHTTSSSTTFDARRTQQSTHTVISSQQPYHHTQHNRYSFPGELFASYNMIQPYQGQSYGSIPGAGLRTTTSDGHHRYPFVTTSTSLPAGGTQVHGPQGTSVRYPLAMMIDPSPVGLNQGLQSSADGHAGDSGHVASSLNQTGNNANSDSPTSVPNSGASPRPSILRKRVSEGSAFRKHPISSLNSHLGRPDSPASKLDITRQPAASPKPSFKRNLNFTKAESESLPNSQQSIESNASETSTDTAPSSVGSVKIKPDPDGLLLNENSQNSNDTHSMLSQIAEEGTPSPRKKQRKQILKAATEHPDVVQDPSTDEEVETKPRISFKTHKKQRKASKSEHMKVVHYVKRTCPRLMDAYKSTCNWKPALNHFERYSDVKAKDDRKTSIHEIANQRGIIKKTEGWKIKHISGQFEDLTTLEQEIHDEIEDMKTGLASLQKQEQPDSEVATVYELVQGSLQRSKYVIDNLDEARTIVLKLLEHKPKVSTILKKHANKRHAKKKNTSP